MLLHDYTHYTLPNDKREYKWNLVSVLFCLFNNTKFPKSHRGMDVCCECCVLSGRGLCDEMITRPEESYWLWCVVVWPRNLKNEEAMTRVGSKKKKKKKKKPEGMGMSRIGSTWCTLACAWQENQKGVCQESQRWFWDLNPGPTKHNTWTTTRRRQQISVNQARRWVMLCYGRLCFSSQLCTTEDLNKAHVS
jgi:hypothetical protein